MKACASCSIEQPLVNFGLDSKRRDRKNPYCKTCRRTKQEEQMCPVRSAMNKLKVSLGCSDCGYDRHPAALEFDHAPGQVKIDNIGNMLKRSREVLLAELAKCELVCANCHRMRTATRGGWNGTHH